MRDWNADPRLMRIVDGEPVFILRANDRLAPFLVRIWIGVARLVGCPRAKCSSAQRTAVAMERWAAQHGSKFPD